MTDRVRSLELTSDQLLERLDLLEQLEAERRMLMADDPRSDAIEDQIAELASQVLEASARQRDTGHAVLRAAPDERRSLDQVPPRELPAILGEWRDAERQAMTAPPGSLAGRTARADVERLRDEHARAHASAARSSGDWARRP